MRKRHIRHAVTDSDCIVPIRKRFLLSLFGGSFQHADGSSGFCKQALRADGGAAVCWTLVRPGGVNNADRHQSGATGTRRPTSKTKSLDSSPASAFGRLSQERRGFEFQRRAARFVPPLSGASGVCD